MQEKLLNRCGYGEEHTHNRKVMKNVLGKTWHHHSSRISSARMSLLESAGLTQILGGKCSCNHRIFRIARTPLGLDIHRDFLRENQDEFCPNIYARVT